MELDGGPGEKHGPISKDWAMMEQKWGLEREDKKEKDGDEEEGSENGPGKSQEEEILLSASC